MGRSKDRKRAHSSSSSSSSSSGEGGKKLKSRIRKKERRIKDLKELVRQLRKKNMPARSGTPPISNSSTSFDKDMRPVVCYVGRNDFVPEFNPQTTSVSIEHWIRNLESTAKMHGWDERTLVCNCTSKLSGYAKAWYEQQASYEINWDEWKEKLIKAFPFTKNKLSQIRELVNRVRLLDEDPIEFFYTKLGIGMSCHLSDEVITEAVIGTLGNKLWEVGAKSAGCRDSGSLLQYLASINSADLGNDNGALSIPKNNRKNKETKTFAI
ncbi:unnamed protein product [Colias eurytheme]|nr:unnamed protein product [Colias eurytheme]